MEFKVTPKLMKYGIVIPMIIFAVAIFALASSYRDSGEFIKKGIDFEGGIQVAVHTGKPVNLHDFENAVKKETGSRDVSIVTTTDPATRKQESIIITASGLSDEKPVISAIEDFLKVQLKPTEYSISILGPALAKTFWAQARLAFIVAFIFMAIVVGFAYKSFVPSIAIVIATAFDLTTIIGFMAFFNVDLTLGTFAALLMMIGFGVDYNIILTEKVFKEKEGDVYDRITRAMRTGLTMAACTLVTLFALYFFGTSPVLKQISFALIIGTFADITNTWFFNGNLLIWSMKRWQK
ncbi:TPA: protein translocase subunit SecF [archaeon]|nr:protein translocase subunit SecF [Candidatus Naiadarchaeales archaeon SRR2090153.bin461]